MSKFTQVKTYQTKNKRKTIFLNPATFRDNVLNESGFDYTPGASNPARHGQIKEQLMPMMLFRVSVLTNGRDRYHRGLKVYPGFSPTIGRQIYEKLVFPSS